MSPVWSCGGGGGGGVPLAFMTICLVLELCNNVLITFVTRPHCISNDCVSKYSNYCSV